MVRFLLCILFFVGLVFDTIAQSHNVDSLKMALKKNENDTDRCSILSDLVEVVSYEESIPFNDSLLALCFRKLKNSSIRNRESYVYKYFLAIAYTNKAIYYKTDSDLSSALVFFNKGLELRKEINDSTNMAGSLNEIGLIYSEKGEGKTALSFFLQSLKIYEIIKSRADENDYAATLNNAGQEYFLLGEPYKSLGYLSKCYSIQEKLGNKRDMSITLNNLGAICQSQGDITNAFSYIERSLKINEQLGYKKGIAGCLANLGVLHSNQKNDDAALNYYFKSLKIAEEIKDEARIAELYNSIGSINQSKGKTRIGLEYYLKSLDIKLKSGNKRDVALQLNNIGHLFHYSGDTGVYASRVNAIKAGKIKALNYYEKSLNLYEEIEDKQGIALVLTNMAFLFTDQAKYEKTILCAKRALALSLEIHHSQRITDASRALSLAYKATGNYKLALENFELSIKMRDSINNESTRKASIKQQLKHEYETKAAADSVLHAKESEIKSAELSRQTAELKAKKNQQYALFGGLFGVCVFGVFMYNRFKVTQKQKNIIEKQKVEVEEQKNLVEQKQKEILDSIHYARRIQLAQIPNEQMVERMLKRFKNRG